MLTELQIKNVAIIDNITINFGAGFNVLTGETGAGKSILIDSINMALGGRTAKDLVRNGTEYAFSQAVFEVNETVGNKLTEYDIELEDNTLILSRKITADGKSSCRINGRTAPLSIVREIGNMLLNIHGQLDNQALLVSSKHREFVDNFAGNKDILAEYSNKYLEYSKVLKKFEELQQSEIDKEHRIEILKESVEYYIKKPVNAQYLYYTIKNLGRLLSINRGISPLTGLPGNVQIHAELKKRISNRENFSVLYLDLDNFKAYNDVYGFLKGDEIIKYTADTIVRCVHNYIHEGAFVGHIGGDDFIAIVPILNCDEICKNIIASFDAHVTKFFTEEDVEKGYIEVANRKGIIEQFPLTSISIGVVEADVGRFANMLEIGEVGAQVKHNAKSVMGSSYFIDRRKK